MEISDWTIMEGDDELQFISCYHVMISSHRVFAHFRVVAQNSPDKSLKTSQNCRIELESLTRLHPHTHQFRGIMHAPTNCHVFGVYHAREDIGGGAHRYRGWIVVMRRCPHCGELVMVHRAKFCHECGKNLQI